MTEEEINIAIAKALNVRFEKRTVCPWCEGNTPYEAGDDYGITIWAKCKTCHNTGKVEPYYVGVPNYCNNLNAMHKAIIHWLDTKKSEYERNESAALLEIAILREMKDVKFVTQSSYLATSQQLATAFLKTLNLTKESK